MLPTAVPPLRTTPVIVICDVPPKMKVRAVAASAKLSVFEILRPPTLLTLMLPPPLLVSVVTVHTVASRDGAVSLRSLACTAWVSQSNTLRSCRRQVSITVNSRSTNRLPAADCVPNDSFRQITA